MNKLSKQKLVKSTSAVIVTLSLLLSIASLWFAFSVHQARELSDDSLAEMSFNQMVKLNLLQNCYDLNVRPCTQEAYNNALEAGR